MAVGDSAICITTARHELSGVYVNMCTERMLTAQKNRDSRWGQIAVSGASYSGLQKIGMSRSFFKDVADRVQQQIGTGMTPVYNG